MHSSSMDQVVVLKSDDLRKRAEICTGRTILRVELIKGFMNKDL